MNCDEVKQILFLGALLAFTPAIGAVARVRVLIVDGIKITTGTREPA